VAQVCQLDGAADEKFCHAEAVEGNCCAGYGAGISLIDAVSAQKEKGQESDLTPWPFGC